MEDLSPSSLGTREQYQPTFRYKLDSWDGVYEVELENFHNHGDEGEIWFGRQCERRIVDWVDKNIPKDSAIIDVGSGNGHLLVSLGIRGFTNLRGIDYSEGAVQLGLKYATSCGLNGITFQQADLMDPETKLDSASLIVDKGTFDAISLAKDDSPDLNLGSEGRIQTSCRKFKDTLLRTLRKDSISRFLITSCNWTNDELCTLFSPEFIICDKVPHQTSFSFGGKQGQTVTTVAFKLSYYE